MNLKIVATALLGATTLTFAPLVAQTAAPAAAPAAAAPVKPLTAADLEGLRAELRSSKKQLTAEALTLTDT